TAGDIGDVAAEASEGAVEGALAGLGGPFSQTFLRDTRSTRADGSRGSGTLIQTLIRASATDNDTNIISAPHILTSDNEEAEIRIGDNIPIPTTRTDAATGSTDGLASSFNIERRDIGVTLRVTPQISEGDSLRLKIFQEITGVNNALSQDVGTVEDVGVSLTNRKIENTVVVSNGETVVVGGLLSNDAQDTVTKVPFLGDIPVLGWAFKTREETVRKNNLLVFLTPHIVRNREDLERESIRRREEFESSAELTVGDALERGEGRNPVQRTLSTHEARYPLARMREIELARAEARERREAEREEALTSKRYGVRAGVFRNDEEATALLTQLLDGGYDGTLVSNEIDGLLLFEVVVGPFEDAKAAGDVADVLERSYSLSPRVTLLEGESGDEEPAP
ncbi:MAG: SPOR domain-containing protein, partial [Proteobacteria bacterium]|nr:SPOR domain-containing protein [Pseudomonadota bacterium]